MVNPRILTEGNNTFGVSTNKFYLKYHDKTSHWVGHSKLIPLDLEDFYKRKIIINGVEAILPGTKIEQLNSGMKNDPYASIVAEVKKC